MLVKAENNLAIGNSGGNLLGATNISAKQDEVKVELQKLEAQLLKHIKKAVRYNTSDFALRKKFSEANYDLFKETEQNEFGESPKQIIKKRLSFKRSTAILKHSSKNWAISCKKCCKWEDESANDEDGIFAYTTGSSDSDFETPFNSLNKQ